MITIIYYLSSWTGYMVGQDNVFHNSMDYLSQPFSYFFLVRNRYHQGPEGTTDSTALYSVSFKTYRLTWWKKHTLIQVLLVCKYFACLLMLINEYAWTGNKRFGVTLFAFFTSQLVKIFYPHFKQVQLLYVLKACLTHYDSNKTLHNLLITFGSAVDFWD